MAEELFQIKGDAPAAPDLRFWSVLGHESLSRPSRYELTVLSENGAIAAKDVLGYAFDVVIGFQDASQGWHERHCHGHAVRFVRIRQIGRYFEYRITLRSWFWLLTKRRNSRILQDMPALDVLDAVFEDSPIRRFKKTLADYIVDPHPPRRYCVQFEESDYHFLSRLLEDEGIYYWFDAHDPHATMHLTDTSSVAHEPLPVAQVLYWQALDRGEARYNQVSAWLAGRRLDTGKWAASDSNFKTIRKDLGAKVDASDDHELADFEEFEFPGGYFNADDGFTVQRRREDELRGRRERHWAVTRWPDVSVGRTFKYQGDPDASRDGSYLVGSCTFIVNHPGYEGLDEAPRPPGAMLDDMLAGDAFHHGSIDALSDIARHHLLPAVGVRGARVFVVGTLADVGEACYKTPRLTPRTRMPGPQSAIVVGPEGEELHVDEFGRVKVHFHWDRYDDRNEKSTCWVRVSQPWAGKGWGGYFAPRIGQEVIVDFLNGDPDRPIIMGRVYNDDQPIPYDSPTQSGFKTRSTPKGSTSNFNELRFEDKKGSEQVFLHAEKNQDIEVENDETHWVGHDRRKTIDNDETTKIGNNRTEEVGSNEKITIGANRTENVGANEDISIGASRTEKVAANESVTIGASRSLDVGASETVNVGASRTETIGAALTQKVGAAYTQTVDGPVTIKSGGPMTLNAAGGLNIIAPGGTKVVDFQFLQFGGDEKVGYATSLNFSVINTEINAVKGEYTSFSNALIPVKFEKVGVQNQEAATEIKNLAASIASGGAKIVMKTMSMVL